MFGPIHHNTAGKNALEVRCPTCLSINDLRMIRSAGNQVRCVVWSVRGPLSLARHAHPAFRLKLRCRRCGARFRTGVAGGPPHCWTCGYDLRGLRDARCLESAMEFREAVLQAIEDPSAARRQWRERSSAGMPPNRQLWLGLLLIPILLLAALAAAAIFAGRWR